MGFEASRAQVDALLRKIGEEYDIYAPKRYAGGGIYSGTDCVRYGKIRSVDEVVFDEKSQYSFKEVLTPVSQTLMYFTEERIEEAAPPAKGAVIFMRSCDVHALKRLDDVYLGNGPADYYYERLRSRIRIVLMCCGESFENCFCVSMGTAQCDNYDMSIEPKDGAFLLDCRMYDWTALLQSAGCMERSVEPVSVSENAVRVCIPENLTADVANARLWREYDSRCIACGRCNFVCPTCTCFTMQDMFYSENGRVGERRRVMASCMVDGYTDIAGGGSYRDKNGDRMRFKVLHKVLDHHRRTGDYMCVGCGRCDDICPEYISFSNCVNRLGEAMRETNG